MFGKEPNRQWTIYYVVLIIKYHTIYYVVLMVPYHFASHYWALLTLVFADDPV